MSARRRRADVDRPRVRTPFALRPALRLGRRLAFAKVGRAALIVALIGIPTAGFAAVSVVVQSTQPTRSEQLRYDLGHAAAQMRSMGPDLPGMRQDPVEWQYSEPAKNSPAEKAEGDVQVANVLDHVPSGAVSIPVGSASIVLSGPKGPIGLIAVEGAVWSKVLAGHWQAPEGPAPPDRAALPVTPPTPPRLGASIAAHRDLTDPAPPTSAWRRKTPRTSRDPAL